MEICAVCLELIEESDPIGAGNMLFHQACAPTCRFCGRRYTVHSPGWDFRGQTVWATGLGYAAQLVSAACGECTDLGERRDYGSGW